MTTADAIDSLLPQTQCRRCGYDGCRPYAEALARRETAINRCPPGGTATIINLARLLETPVLAPDPACGTALTGAVAVIDPGLCIGCTLCIQACPVDAIIGARRLMHRVVPDDCTGCELCIPPCPMDCIVMAQPQRSYPSGGIEPPALWTAADAERARQRHQARRARLEREARDDERRREVKGALKLEELAARDDLDETAKARKRAVVEQALARARLRRAGGQIPASTGGKA